jgi:enterochelin esterase-like enzyme/outer membrane protein assembly factor BamB
MKQLFPRTLGLVLFSSLLFVSPGQADDWLQWGGPNGDFTLEVEGLAEWWPEDGPKVLWKRPLGGGYSSILFKNDQLFTMYRDGDDEVVVSLDARTGATRWEHRYLAEIWPDMTPAFGLGPNATPLIVGDRIISIGIDGQVRCLDLSSGELKWKHDLPAEFGRRKRDEEYGYSNHPMHYKGNVIVLVGGTDHAVVAFDPADGSTVWKSEPGGISYAATTLTTLGGRDQFVYFEPEGVVGLDPSTGRTLWRHEMEYNNGNHLTPIVKCDENHIWVGSQFPSGGGRLLEITSSGKKWSARRIWFETYLRASHWTSIRIGDFIYGSTGGNEVSLLTAFNWKTGEVAWRHRGFHKAQSLYADGKLLFLDEDGLLGLAKVSPEGLEVLDSAQVTESISWTLPTLVDTTLFARDKKNILALDLAVSGGERTPRAAADDLAEPAMLLGQFGEFVRKVNDAENKKGMIDEFMRKQGSFPIVEDSLVHFVFRGDVPDVAVMGNFLELGQAETLYLVEGTDLYFRTYQLTPAAHFEYRFSVFEDRMADPLNPRRLTSSDDSPSVVTTAGWSEPSHLRKPAGRRGHLEKFPWKSEILENEREITVYLPPGYKSSDRRYPVVVVNYGNQALEEGKWVNSLDNLIGTTVAPLIAVFVPRVDFDEYAPKVTRFADAIEQELLAHVDKQYRTQPGAENRAMTGIASGGFASVFVALGKPELIGKVAVQSFYFRGEAEDRLRSMIENGDERATLFYVEWSINDLVASDQLQCEKASRELATMLAAEGYRVTTNEVADGAGWGSWRARTDRILEGFFPLEK